MQVVAKYPFLLEASMKDDRRLFKMAHIIHSNLVEWTRAVELARFERFSPYVALSQRLSSLVRQHKKAMDHSWFLAANRTNRQIVRALHDLNHAMQDLGQINLKAPVPPASSVILADLRELEREWGPVEFNAKDQTLSVMTEAIELKGICLGRFSIELALSQLKALHRLTPYRCLAQEPNPAGTDETVTHPHVSNDDLCEGDGKVPIRRALEQGRLCDFFTLITHILTTYNADSPYVSLDDWEGTPCYDCGATVTPQDCYMCHECDLDFCDECSGCCNICDMTCCLHCGGICHGCDQFVCRSCVDQCKACHLHFCIDCLTDGLCETCIERKEQDHETKEEVQETHLLEAKTSETMSTQQIPSVAVQPDSMGQAPVLQGQDAQ